MEYCRGRVSGKRGHMDVGIVQSSPFVTQSRYRDVVNADVNVLAVATVREIPVLKVGFPR